MYDSVHYTPAGSAIAAGFLRSLLLDVLAKR